MSSDSQCRECERLRDALAAERAQLVDIFRRSPAPMAVLAGERHVFELVNGRFAQLVGDRPLVGLPAGEAMPEVAAQGLVDLLDRVRSTGEPYQAPEASVVVQRDAGSPPETLRVEFVFEPITGPEGEVQAILAHGIDQTARHRATEALHERDARLRLFVENVSDYVVAIMDPAMRIVEWQGAAEQVTGWCAADAIGQSGEILFTGEDRASGMPALERAKALELGRAEDRRWHLRRDGSRFFADGVLTCLRGAHGELLGFGKLMRDVTERRLAEQQLVDADRRKDEFIAMLAHELRNPLAPIRNGLQVLRLAGDDANTRNQVREVMERQLVHMVRLIDDLLDISRIGQNKVALRREPVLLSEVVALAVETARPLLESAGHTLSIELPVVPLVLDADNTRLSQVLSNLLANSAKYTPHGGRIAVRAVREEGELVLTVSDTGIGIPAEALPRVFDLFTQVERGTGRTGGGLGIGLALVKGLVEMHGGSVRADSPGLGKGSQFVVRLPLPASAADPRADAQPEVPTLSSAAPRRILVVDDNVDSAMTLARMLVLMGNNVEVAHDGEQAVRTAGEFHPELVFMDLGMPVVDGFEATRRLRAEAWGSDIRVVALSGWGQDADRRMSAEAGCDEHLVKPVALTDLERILHAL